MKDKINIKSPSKINLCLEVLGKNNNELHEIKSVAVNLDLSDDLIIEKSDTFEIVSNIDLPVEDNIIYQAYEFFQKKFYIFLKYFEKIKFFNNFFQESYNLKDINKAFNDLYLGRVIRPIIKH